MKKVLLVFGTRPEAIKMCPIIKELDRCKEMEQIVCVTGQHKEMLQQVLDVFQVVPNYNLDIMKHRQDLFSITSTVLNEIKVVLEIEKPDIVLVHGDTTSAFATALACYYKQIPIAHVEAGLRTYNKFSPFPEEANRVLIDDLAALYFAPTVKAKNNLINEKKKESSIYITGNTVIDALKTTIRNDYQSELTNWIGDSRLILLTAHRRENLGQTMEQMFLAIKMIVNNNPNVKVIYPVHLNPQVQDVAKRILGNDDRIRLVAPLNVVDFHNLMNAAYLIMTDSGGIQEEAPSLGKPVIVMRDTTERPEGVEAGTLLLAGTTSEKIYEAAQLLLTNQEKYVEMSKASNPYGDGRASAKIVQALVDFWDNMEGKMNEY